MNTKQYQSGTDSDSVVSEVTSTASSSLHVKSSELGVGGDKAMKARTTPLKLGDRVIVNASSGTKLGTLMFLGEFLLSCSRARGHIFHNV